MWGNDHAIDNLAVFLFVSPVYAQGTSQDADGIPGSGATINLKPTSSGYEADIILPAAKYTRQVLSSSDPVIPKS